MFRSRLSKAAAELKLIESRAAKAAAEIVAAKARELVPVGPGEIHLRDRIHVEEADDGDGWFVVAGDNEAWYGHIVEHGGAHSAPHPFLVPAGEQSRGEIAALMAAAGRALL